MRGPAAIAIRVAVAAVVCLGLGAEIIERIAVSVGTQVITTSDIEREIRITSFLNGVPPDFSVTARKAAAERMVEQRLVLKELRSNRYPEPESGDVAPALEEFKKKNYPLTADYEGELAKRGITEEDVRDMLLWQRRLLLFLDIRFKPGVTVSAQDIQNYFAKEVVPRASGPVSLDTYRDEIEARLSADMANRQMDAWLENARQHSQIVYHPEAFQ